MVFGYSAAAIGVAFLCDLAQRIGGIDAGGG
jgi:hypothetical protein